MHTHHEVNFSTDVEGLAEAASPEVVRLADGDTHEITIEPVRKRIGDADIRMLGYNGSIPGPTLHVDQGSEVTVEATNLGDVDATLHWHGLRLDNR
jgi:FtsP/CotA-like multicopper oxidase with cupredoxin domain